MYVCVQLRNKRPQTAQRRAQAMTRQPASPRSSEPASQRSSKPASERSSKPEIQQARNPVSQQARDPASQQARHPASQRSSKPEIQQACKPEIQQASTAFHDKLAHLGKAARKNYGRVGSRRYNDGKILEDCIRNTFSNKKGSAVVERPLTK